MQLQWWWNGSFEDLMETFGTWLKEQGNITIANMDWKYQTEPNADSAGNRSGYWYMVVVYKPAVV